MRYPLHWGFPMVGRLIAVCVFAPLRLRLWVPHTVEPSLRSGSTACRILSPMPKLRSTHTAKNLLILGHRPSVARASSLASLAR